ncbi:LysR family transcriptional regulator [Vibrio sp. ZSDE26]|uniref:LysR family transcriptional regulator n=1 Tax=Vibrio amylolyticus TaxID=2847292 RepID=A0A9X1XLT7_9VIBR|nr:LysR family transcriptional regulator [Vibrio amylolyticus]MCK6264088.1 LysR family transcriptional regulator [Vibrio amylolyticus]
MIDNLDIRSMRVLIDLNETKNTYLTAERLDLSQSAVARILTKNRATLNDPLYVRVANKLEPTPLMEELIDKLPNIIESLEQVVSTNFDFDPHSLTGRYQIFLNHPTQQLFGHDIFQKLSMAAPNATWYLKGWESNAVEQFLDDRATVGINYFASNYPKSIVQQTFAKDEFLVFAQPNHPLFKKTVLSWQEIYEYPFISLSVPSWDEKQEKFNQVCNALGGVPQIKLQTDSISLAIQAAENSQMLLPSSLRICDPSLTSLKPLKLTIDKAQLPDTPIVISYAQKNANKPIIKWAIEMITSLYEEKVAHG